MRFQSPQKPPPGPVEPRLVQTSLDGAREAGPGWGMLGTEPRSCPLLQMSHWPGGADPASAEASGCSALAGVLGGSPRNTVGQEGVPRAGCWGRGTSLGQEGVPRTGSSALTQG